MKAENEAGAWAPARFSLFTEVPKKRPKSCQNGFQKAPKSDPKRPRRRSKNDYERYPTNDPEINVERVGQRMPKGVEPESPFLVSGEQRAPRGVLKGSLELP